METVSGNKEQERSIIWSLHIFLLPINTQLLIWGKHFPHEMPLKYFQQGKIEIKARCSFISMQICRKVLSLQLHATPLDSTSMIILGQSKGPSAQSPASHSDQKQTREKITKISRTSLWWYFPLMFSRPPQAFSQPDMIAECLILVDFSSMSLCRLPLSPINFYHLPHNAARNPTA